MYPQALAQITCPNHPATPLFLEAGPTTAADDAVLDGTLRCPTCRARYHIRNGIADLLGPRHLPDSPAQLTNILPLTAWAYERIWRPRALSLLAGEPLGYERELPLIGGLLAPERGGLYVDVACSNGLYARAIARALQGAARADSSEPVSPLDQRPTTENQPQPAIGPSAFAPDLSANARPGGSTSHVIGIDHSLPMLRQARAYAQAEGLRISFVRAKAQRLPLADRSVAGLAMGGSLNEIGDADGALRELARTLAHDGRCVMMGLISARTPPGRTLQALLGTGGITFWPLEELNRRLAAAGLRLRAQWRHRVVIFSLLTLR